SGGQTIFIADAHRGDGKRFVVRADEKLTAFVFVEPLRGMTSSACEPMASSVTRFSKIARTPQEKREQSQQLCAMYLNEFFLFQRSRRDVHANSRFFWWTALEAKTFPRRAVAHSEFDETNSFFPNDPCEMT